MKLITEPAVFKSYHDIEGTKAHKHLTEELSHVNKSLHVATGEDVYRLQGRAQLLTELLDLIDNGLEKAQAAHAAVVRERKIAGASF